MGGSTIQPDVIKVLSERPGILFEGLALDPSDDFLSWVDIIKGRIYSLRISGTQEIRRELPITLPSSTNLSSDELVVTAGRSVYWLDKLTLEIRREISIPSANKRLVTNEAKFDPFGNLWIGLMDRGGSHAPGELWSLTPAGEFRLHLTNIGIPNTLIWDTKRDRFYFGDSLAGSIFVTQITPEGSITKYREFIGPDFAPGVPDGSALIVESGEILNCRWDGGCLVRISVDGRKIQQWDLPWRRPTDIAFGPGGGEVVVSTAAVDKPRGDLYSSGAVIRLSL